MCVCVCVCAWDGLQTVHYISVRLLDHSNLSQVLLAVIIVDANPSTGDRLWLAPRGPCGNMTGICSAKGDDPDLSECSHMCLHLDAAQTDTNELPVITGTKTGLI